MEQSKVSTAAINQAALDLSRQALEEFETSPSLDAEDRGRLVGFWRGQVRKYEAILGDGA